jgi:hypothetical protein
VYSSSRRIVVAGLAAGCGGDDEPETTPAATEWACTALGTWGNELQRAGQTLNLSPSTETIRDAADDISAATDELVAELDALGAQATEGGPEVIDAVDELASTLEDQISEVESTVESLGVSEEEGVPASTIPPVSEAFAAMRTASAEALQTIQTVASQSELEDAFEQASSCDPLTGSS